MKHWNSSFLSNCLMLDFETCRVDKSAIWFHKFTGRVKNANFKNYSNTLHTLAVLLFFLWFMHSHVIVVVCVTNIDDMTHFAREGSFVMNSCLVDDKIDFLCKSLCTLIAKEVHLVQMFDDDWSDSVKSWCFAFHLLRKGFLL